VDESGVDDASLETLREDFFRDVGGWVGVEKETDEKDGVAVETASEF
jgi:hypothetical protein